MKKKKSLVLLLFIAISLSLVSTACKNEDEDNYRPSEYSNKIKSVKSYVGMSETEINSILVDSLHCLSSTFFEDNQEKLVYYYPPEEIHNDSTISGWYLIGINKVKGKLYVSSYMKVLDDNQAFYHYEKISQDFINYVQPYSIFTGHIYGYEMEEYYSDKNKYFENYNKLKDTLWGASELYSKNNLISSLGVIELSISNTMKMSYYYSFADTTLSPNPLTKSKFSNLLNY